jgi:transglutaminase-like putative cysteine protease
MEGMRGNTRASQLLLCATALLFLWSQFSWAATVPPLPRSAAHLTGTRFSATDRISDTLRLIRRISRDTSRGGAQDASSRAEQLAQIRQRLQAADQDAKSGFASDSKFLAEHRLPQEIKRRHQEALAHYEERYRELASILAKADAATDDAAFRTRLADAANWAQHYLQHDRHPAVNPRKLPFRAVTREAKAPRLLPDQFPFAFSEPVLELASNGSLAGMLDVMSIPPSAADLQPTEDVQLTQSITTLASQLHQNPIEIYNWVHDNIEFTPTFGSVQGSESTLQNLIGNDFDMASLLIALLRASGIPARYAIGTIQVPAATVTAWLGTQNVGDALQLLGDGGIANTALVQSGTVKAVRFEHVWVEAWVNMYPGRGAKRAGDASWVSLDASFKQYQLTPKPDLATAAGVDHSTVGRTVAGGLSVDPQTGALTNLFPGYIQAAVGQDLSKLQQYIASQNPSLKVSDVLGSREIVPIAAHVLPTALPYSVVAVGQRYSRLADTYRHHVTINLYLSAEDQALESPSLTYRVDLPQLGAGKLGATFVPASDSDAATLDAYRSNGSTSLPAYLIHMKPSLRINDVEVAGTGAMTMGSPIYWGITLSDASGDTGTEDVFQSAVGDEIVFGVDAAGKGQGSIDAFRNSGSELTASNNMFRVSLQFWMEHDLMDEYWARSFGVRQVRLPSVGMFVTPLTVAYRFGLPHSAYYQTRVMDVKRNVLAVAGGNPQLRADYLRQSGITGSYLEGSTFDQLFNRFQSVGQSTTQIFNDAAELGIPIFYIDATNVDLMLPLVDASEDVKSNIQNAVNAGSYVVIPKTAPGDFQGYSVIDPQTGAGAYQLEFGASGGGQSDCKPEAEPVVKAITEIFLTLLFLAALAALIVELGPVVVGALGAAGSATATAVAELMAAFGITSLVFAGNAYAGTRDPCCEAIPSCPHAGGDPIHDQCADDLPPNEFYRCDALVDGTKFDAISGGRSILWEVKTDNYDNQNEFVRTMAAQSIASQVRAEALKARRCEYRFNLGLGDNRLAQALAALGVVPPVVDAVIIDEALCRQPSR